MPDAKNNTFIRETPRLVLRQFQPADAPHIFAYRNDPDVARYQSWTALTEQEAQQFVIAQDQIGIPNQWVQIAVEAKAVGHLIGDCGMKVIQDAGQPDDGRQAEIGYSFAQAHQGQGFAQEAVSALLDYSFTDLRLHRIIAITDCRNAPSIALLERLGFRREAHFIEGYWFKGAWVDEYLYAILRREWQPK